MSGIEGQKKKKRGEPATDEDAKRRRKLRRQEEEEAESDADSVDYTSEDESEEGEKTRKRHKASPAASSAAPCDIQRASDIVAQTLVLATRLEKKYGEEAQSVMDRAKEAKERIVTAAVKAWFSRNFSRYLSDSFGSLVDDGQARCFSRTHLREIINEFLAVLGLPRLSRRDETWTKRVLKECLGYGDAEWRSGREIPLRDFRSLVNFENALIDMLTAVRKERVSAEALA